MWKIWGHCSRPQKSKQILQKSEICWSLDPKNLLNPAGTVYWKRPLDILMANACTTSFLLHNQWFCLFSISDESGPAAMQHGNSATASPIHHHIKLLINFFVVNRYGHSPSFFSENFSLRQINLEFWALGIEKPEKMYEFKSEFSLGLDENS